MSSVETHGEWSHQIIYRSPGCDEKKGVRVILLVGDHDKPSQMQKNAALISQYAQKNDLVLAELPSDGSIISHELRARIPSEVRIMGWDEPKHWNNILWAIRKGKLPKSPDEIAEFVSKSYPTRQQALVKRLLNYLQLADRVFVIAGRAHLLPPEGYKNSLVEHGVNQLRKALDESGHSNLVLEAKPANIGKHP